MIEHPGIVLTLVSFALVIGTLVFIHELGHYLAGRAFGVKAEAFSIGFGREVFGWTDKRGTRWRLALLPLGGYVRFAGDMSPASEPTAEWLALPAAERNRTFQAKPLWQKAIIVAAGPAINFLFAVLVFACFFAAFGDYRTPTTVATVERGSAAAAAGLQPGDRITAVAGRSVDRFEDIAAIVVIRPNQRMDVDLVRGRQAMRLSAVPRADAVVDRFGNRFERGLLGISPGRAVLTRVPWTEIPGQSVRHTANIVVMIAETLKQVVVGERSAKEMGGPLSIARFSGETATLGALALVQFMAMISINLGFINLLPIPMLDGGHLMFYAIEAVRRRPVGARAQELAFRTGFALLLAFMALATVNDLGSLGLWDGIAGLIARG